VQIAIDNNVSAPKLLGHSYKYGERPAVDVLQYRNAVRSSAPRGQTVCIACTQALGRH